MRDMLDNLTSSKINGGRIKQSLLPNPVGRTQSVCNLNHTGSDILTNYLPLNVLLLPKDQTFIFLKNY